jgi:hypothetical protein
MRRAIDGLRETVAELGVRAAPAALPPAGMATAPPAAGVAAPRALAAAAVTSARFEGGTLGESILARVAATLEAQQRSAEALVIGAPAAPAGAPTVPAAPNPLSLPSRAAYGGLALFSALVDLGARCTGASDDDVYVEGGRSAAKGAEEAAAAAAAAAAGASAAAGGALPPLVATKAPLTSEEPGVSLPRGWLAAAGDSFAFRFDASRLAADAAARDASTAAAPASAPSLVPAASSSAPPATLLLRGVQLGRNESGVVICHAQLFLGGARAAPTQHIELPLADALGPLPATPIALSLDDGEAKLGWAFRALAEAVAPLGTTAASVAFRAAVIDGLLAPLRLAPPGFRSAAAAAAGNPGPRGGGGVPPPRPLPGGPAGAPPGGLMGISPPLTGRTPGDFDRDIGPSFSPAVPGHLISGDAARARGGEPGSLVGPDHPLFLGRGEFGGAPDGGLRPGRALPPGVPPGARFDP